MASIVAIIIQECPGGVSVEQIRLRRGTELEDKIASVMDFGLRLTQETVVKELTKAGEGEATILEGNNLEKAMSAGLREIGGINFRELLDKAGFETK